jgi:hypothetical protein
MKKRFIVCIRNRGYEAALERRKLYEVLPDSAAEDHQQVRIIDESGDDYLYPEDWFAPVRLPARTKQSLATA